MLDWQLCQICYPLEIKLLLLLLLLLPTEPTCKVLCCWNMQDKLYAKPGFLTMGPRSTYGGTPFIFIILGKHAHAIYSNLSWV